MNSRTTTLAISIMAALYLSGNATAQETKPSSENESTPVQELDTITVTGYRGSLARSQAVKRNANSIVDAISAEDIGKFPDRNAAESLAHLPGVAVDRLYGEGEKVSINGTDPALNRILVNGQTIASGDWGGAPGDTSGRTFNYTLLAPEIIGLMEVYKSPEARIDEGSIGGTVIVHTRKPLELPANTIRGSVGYLYNDRSENSDPRASLLYSWKNSTDDFGVLLALSHDKQRLSQGSVQFFGGYVDGSGIPASTTITGGGDPSNARLPFFIDSSVFDQERKRDSAQAAVQWKLNDQNEFNLTGIYVKGKYDNFSQSRYFAPGAGNQVTQFTAANVENGQVTSGTLVPTASNGGTVGPNGDIASYGQLDANYRSSTITTKSINLSHEFTADSWRLKSQVGYTSANGGKDPEYLMKWLMQRGGYSFDYGNESAGITLDDASASNWQLTPGQQAGGIYYSVSKDNERYGQMDLSHDVEWGPIKEILVGAKYLKHENGNSARGNSLFTASGTTLDAFNPQNVSSSLFDGIDVNSGISGWPSASPNEVKAFLLSLPGADEFPNLDRGSSFNVVEKTKNFYTQFNYELNNFRGNFGVRYVDTTDDSLYYLTNYDALGNPTYTRTTSSKDYRKFLPSFNIAYDIDDTKVVRFSAAKVIARPRYSDLAGATQRDDQKLTGGGGNPDLDPYQATNYDVAAEWYFAPLSLLGAEFFYRDVDNYIVTIANDQDQFNPLSQKVESYSISSPFNGAKAKVRGISLLYQQDLGYGFGISSNYTYTNSSTSSGLNLPYLSKTSYSVTPYYEKGPWSLRLIYNYRSEYFTQFGRLNSRQFTGAYKQLDLSGSYQINDALSVSLSAQNLLDETYYQYNNNEQSPVGIYKNGRIYVAQLNLKF